MATRAALLALASLLAATGCIQDDGTRWNPFEVIIPARDEDREREQGRDFDRELGKHVTIINDPVVAGFLNDLGQAVVKEIEPQPFIYRFRVIRDPSLNAFAVPGGYIYFHSGTLLAASSIQELAGVMGHEIAHVKARHHFRMQEKTQVPDLVASLGGIAAAVATGEPGLVIAPQAINVAIKLHYSREFETEADSIGAVFMARAGYDPEGITRFFERILAEEEAQPAEVPPYLFSHPDVEKRIATVRAQAKSLEPTKAPDPALEKGFREAQTRLARLIDSGRATLPGASHAADPGLTDPYLLEAEDLAAAGKLDDALVVLARAETLEHPDPRVSFRIGELHARQGRPREAVVAYQRTVRLDASHALVFYQLGLAHRDLGERHGAVYAFEQAILRAGDASTLRKRAEWEVEKLTFVIVPESGFVTGGKTPLEELATRSRESFPPGSTKISWWARLGPHFVPYAKRMTVRWTDPTGAIVQEKRAQRHRKPYVGSVLNLNGPGARSAGTWTVELQLRDEIVHRSSFRITDDP